MKCKLEKFLIGDWSDNSRWNLSIYRLSKWIFWIFSFFLLNYQYKIVNFKTIFVEWMYVYIINFSHKWIKINNAISWHFNVTTRVQFFLPTLAMFFHGSNVIFNFFDRNSSLFKHVHSFLNNTCIRMYRYNFFVASSREWKFTCSTPECKCINV